MTFVESLDELTPEVVAHLLRSAALLRDDDVVVDVDVMGFAAGIGMAGQVARVRCRLAPGGDRDEVSVVVKLPSGDASLRAVADELGMYEREGRFYESIATTLAIRTPRAHLNHIDTSANTFGLLLEDLADYHSFDQRAGLDPAMAAVALTSVAQLHAAFWGSDRLDDLPWLPTSTAPDTLGGIFDIGKLLWPTFLARYRELLPDGAVALGRRLFADPVTFFGAALADTPTTFCHGDFRSDNLLFADDGTDVAVIDWQLANRGPGAADCAYLLAQSLTIDDRRRHERDLLRTWYDSLADRITDPDAYSFDRAWLDYRHLVLFSAVYPVIGGGSHEPGRIDASELYGAMAQRAFTAAVDLADGDLI